MNSMQKCLLLVAVAGLAACAQPENGSESAASTTGLDMSKGPNKVTADDYEHTPVPVDIRDSVPSVDANGNVAPFGMASRAQRDVAPAVVSAVADTAQSAVYAAQCVACHGADAKGVEGLGLDLTSSQLVADASAAELVEFLKAGRMPTDPASVTGIPMPGFAWMPADQLDEVAVYLKSL